VRLALGKTILRALKTAAMIPGLVVGLGLSPLLSIFGDFLPLVGAAVWRLADRYDPFTVLATLLPAGEEDRRMPELGDIKRGQGGRGTANRAAVDSGGRAVLSGDLALVEAARVLRAPAAPSVRYSMGTNRRPGSVLDGVGTDDAAERL
jgi:hypothetical protein